MNGVILRADGISTGYHRRGKDKKVVSGNLDLSVSRGEVTALIGPNGSGKSTLLRTIAGLQPPLSGDLFIEDRSFSSYTVRQRARKISVVLTGRSVPGHMTAERLVHLGRYPHTNLFASLTEKDMAAIEWALSSAGAAELRSRPVDELSDGELQKVMIARALAQEPRIILLDEPTAFLDITRKLELMHLLREISRDNSTAVLVSSHDLELVLQVADTIWLMDEEGRVHCGRSRDENFFTAIKTVFHIPESYSIINGTMF